MPLRVQAFVTASFERKRLTRVPKNGVSRSKRLLKPQPNPSVDGEVAGDEVVVKESRPDAAVQMRQVADCDGGG